MTKSSKKKTKPTAKSKAAKPVKRRTTSSMDTTEIRDFISFIAQSGLNEVKIETAKLKLHIKRSPDQEVPYTTTSPLPAPRPTTLLPAQKQEDAVPEKNTSESTSIVEVKSPMIGTFYRSANPTTDPFVSVGDKIKKGQVVCIIEAMKLFNEIESEVSGTVTKVIAENSSPVEYGQPLFLIDLD